MSIYYATGYALSSPQLLTANYTFIYTAGDDASTCTLSIHAFNSFPYLSVAKLFSVTINPSQSYTTSETFDELGNRVLTIRFPCAPDAKYTVTLLQYMMNSRIRFNVDPSKIGAYDKTSLWYRTYTSPTQYVESDNPEIIAASKQVVGNETNPYLEARKIFNFVLSIPFDDSRIIWNSASEGALYFLKSRSGVCRHHAALFVALSRAAGIPAAMVLGVWGDGGPINHDWVQFYLPNYGWVVAEPTPTGCQGNTCFGGVGDAQHTPLISVNYVYRIAYCRPCNNLVDVFATNSGNGPNLSNGFPSNVVSLNDPEIQSMRATVALDTANATVRTAKTDGRIVGLENATSLLANATAAFAQGDYASTILLSQEAQQAADLARRPQMTLTSTSTASTTLPSQTSLHDLTTGMLSAWLTTSMGSVALAAVMITATLAIIVLFMRRNTRKPLG